VAPRSFLLDDALAAYLVDHCGEPDQVSAALIQETQGMGEVGGLQISPEEGALLKLLTRLVGARRALELGTFTGYSALCIARGLAPGGQLVCCDLSEEWTAVGRRYWRRAGVEDRIDVRLGPAADTLRAMPEEPAFDLVFIDADKPSYPEYWELVVPLVRPGGVILADNTLRRGRVADPAYEDEAVIATRQFNDLVAVDGRTESVITAVADGLTIALKL
jgi:caffeoyl-CoA O-methyltransferase